METWVFASSILLWIVVLLNLVLTLALVRRINSTSGSSPTIETGPPLGEKAPDFTATTLAGETVTLASYTGHAMTLLFVAPHCRHCNDLLKILSARIREVTSELTVVFNSSPQEAEVLTRDLDIHFPLLLAPSSENPFFESYNISATPSYCSLNEQGVVQAKGVAGPNEQPWQNLMEGWSKELEHASHAL